ARAASFRETSTGGARASCLPCHLVRFCAGVLDDLGPARHLPADVFVELLRGARDDLELDVEQALPYLGRGEDPHELAVIGIDDVPRRPARRPEHAPRDALQ